MLKIASPVRRHARTEYIEPARRRGDRRVQIRVGDVHRALALINRVPGVCQALSSDIFLDANHLVLESREGPPSGQSTTVVFTYRLLDPTEVGRPPEPPSFWELRGIAKQAFARQGGGEAYLRRERRQFRSPVERPRG